MKYNSSKHTRILISLIYSWKHVSPGYVQPLTETVIPSTQVATSPFTMDQSVSVSSIFFWLPFVNPSSPGPVIFHSTQEKSLTPRILIFSKNFYGVIEEEGERERECVCVFWIMRELLINFMAVFVSQYIHWTGKSQQC